MTEQRALEITEAMPGLVEEYRIRTSGELFYDENFADFICFKLHLTPVEAFMVGMGLVAQQAMDQDKLVMEDAPAKEVEVKMDGGATYFYKEKEK